MVTAQLSTGKSIAVCAIVVGCFAVLWPKIFFPFFRDALSTSGASKELSMVHPRLKQMIKDNNHPNDMNIIRTSEPPRHPYPPMASRQVPRPGSQKQGAMGFVLPLYTAGIVVFFLYTILKLAVRGKDNINEQEVVTSEQMPPFPDERILLKNEIDSKLCKLLLSEDYKKEMVQQFKDNCRMFFTETQQMNKKRKEIKQKAENKKDLEIIELRRKLAETESAMEEILKQNENEEIKEFKEKITSETETLLTNKMCNNYCENDDQMEKHNSYENETATNEDHNSDSSDEFESETESENNNPEILPTQTNVEE